MGRKSRDKGRRAELEIVHLHEGLDVPCARGQAAGDDRDDDNAPDVVVGGLRPGDGLHAEVKARAGGGGFKMLERWLGDGDLLFLRRDRQSPLVLVTWDAWRALVTCWYGHRELEGGAQ